MFPLPPNSVSSLSAYLHPKRSSLIIDIHRLGRTARAGAEGHGVLILTPDETFFLKDKIIRDLTLHPIPAGTNDEVAQWQSQIDGAMDRVDPESKAQAYRAWLGYYKAFLKSMGWDSAQLVQEANAYSQTTLRFGPTPPGIEKKTIGKMGLKGVPGLNITAGPDGGDRGGGGGNRGGGGGRGGGVGGRGGGGGNRGGAGGNRR